MKLSDRTLSSLAMRGRLKPVPHHRFLPVDQRAGADPLACRVAWAFVGLGLVLRVVRLALNHPLWGDESYLAANILTRDWAGLTHTLDFAQVAPIFFLLVEKGVVVLLGPSEFALRLFPTLCGLASLVLFRHLAGLWLRGAALPLAVGILAVAFYPIRHGGEAKPYASDLLAALVLIVLASHWLMAPRESRWVWALVVAAPLAILLSMPSLFIVGTIGFVMMLRFFAKEDRSPFWATLMFLLTTLLAFVSSLQLIARAELDAEVMSILMRDWRHAGAFAPERVRDVPLWFLRNHSSQMFAYPVGGGGGLSVVTTSMFLIGAFTFGRRREWWGLGLFLMPFGLGMLAALMGKYPYGATARTMQYVAPSICLMAGLGLDRLVARFSNTSARGRRLAYLFAGLAATGIVSLVIDAARPYKTVYERNARDFARWFWTDLSHDAELVCMHTDLGFTFDPHHWQVQRTAAYLCDQTIYSARHRRGHLVRWSAISAEHPLRCVLFNEHPKDDTSFQTWLDSMKTDYNLVAVREYPVNRGAVGRAWDYRDYYIVYEFVPKVSPPPVGVQDDYQALNDLDRDDLGPLTRGR